jgi:predicted ribosomally synthesized peptide with nif11-like leader
MAGVKAFKEKIIKDEAFAKKFENVGTPEGLVSAAKAEGFDFTVEDVKNNTELTEIELSAVAGGASILAKTYFVTNGSVFAGGYFVNKSY